MSARADSTRPAARPRPGGLGFLAAVLAVAVTILLVARIAGGGGDGHPASPGPDPAFETPTGPAPPGASARPRGARGRRATRAARRFVAAWLSPPAPGGAQRARLRDLSTRRLARRLGGFRPAASAAARAGSVFDVLPLSATGRTASVLVTSRESADPAGEGPRTTRYALYLLRLRRGPDGRYRVERFEPQL